jgi:hypothetical protein
MYEITALEEGWHWRVISDDEYETHGWEPTKLRAANAALSEMSQHYPVAFLAALFSCHHAV